LMRQFAILTSSILGLRHTKAHKKTEAFRLPFLLYAQIFVFTITQSSLLSINLQFSYTNQILYSRINCRNIYYIKIILFYFLPGKQQNHPQLYLQNSILQKL